VRDCPGGGSVRTGLLVPVWLRTEARVENSFKFLPERPMGTPGRNRSFARERDGLFPTKAPRAVAGPMGNFLGHGRGRKFDEPVPQSWSPRLSKLWLERQAHGPDGLGRPLGLRFGGGTMEGRRALTGGPWSVPSGVIRLHCPLAATARVCLPALTPRANRTFRAALIRMRVRARCAFEVP